MSCRLRPALPGVPREKLNGLASPLAPGEVGLLEYLRSPSVTCPGRIALVQAQSVRASRIAIEAVAPAVPDGAFLVKAVAGQAVTVSTDVFADGRMRSWRPPCCGGPLTRRNGSAKDFARSAMTGGRHRSTRPASARMKFGKVCDLEP
jgi:hypothetical protein